MTTKELTRNAIYLALLIVCSQLSINIGAVPFTLQTLAVLLIGFNLAPRHAFVVTSLYTLMGLIGLPVFANWSGGMQSVLSPTFGFILSFIVASVIVATYLQKHPQRSWQHYAIAATLATLIIYAIGMAYFAGIINGMKGANMSFSQIIALTMIPFIPGDIAKAALATIISQRLPRN